MPEESISKAMQLQMISVVIHSCSSIARNPNRYQAFHRATKGHFKYAELKSFMRD